MAVDEMKKNVEKLDELEEALKNAQEELIVSQKFHCSTQVLNNESCSVVSLEFINSNGKDIIFLMSEAWNKERNEFFLRDLNCMINSSLAFLADKVGIWECFFFWRSHC